jgi:hypothetical protein
VSESILVNTKFIWHLMTKAAFSGGTHLPSRKTNGICCLKGWLIPSILILCFSLNGAAQTQNPLPSDTGISLVGSIVAGPTATPLLRLILTNTSKQPVSLITGTITGSTPHPAAAFRFFLEMADHHKTQLACTIDECGWGPVAGSLAPYIVYLAPAETYSIHLPLDAFWKINHKGGRLCDEEMQDARVLVTFASGSWELISSGSQHHIQLQQNLADGRTRLSKEALTTSVSLRCR